MTDKYLQELLEEKDLLDPKAFVHSIRLIEDEILRVTGKDNPQDYPRGSETEMGDMDEPEKKTRYRTYAGGVVTEEVVKLNEKVIVPVKEYPKFNFVGKLLGPRGNTLKRLQQQTQTRMSVLGKGSTRDKAKEEELRSSDDPKYEHLKEPLHVLIEVEAPKSEAHARLAAALAEIKKYMVPENDEIRQEQMREMALLNSYENSNEPSSSIHHTNTIISRSRPLAPIVRVGIPPPGAIILNGAQPQVAVRGRVSHVPRGRSVRPLSVPRHGTTAPEYAYDAYDTFDATYEGYPDSGNVYYDYDDYPSTSTGRREKRPSVQPRYPSKKYRADPYADVTYPSQDAGPYRSASLH